ncbi:ABC transporter substrate-binding protein [Methylobacterium variabile]|jgi:putative spermidine/putrescine transport system substrate-binding protein|uniref:ABC transporter substrate-binding protein n=1 Tax=Methylobacterium variabile TaxID=298794 RepID=A0A0J6UZ19_9HYPH|nr:extracellular solute-binding protein [Methylobacterium variabile]KMO31661.1 ABC transporter substrate-binding protein [Methylobacterium variabile]
MITRRTLMARSLAGGAALGLAGTLPARAQSSSIVVGTWGGDYGALLQQNIDVPLLKPQGIEVSQDIANNDPRRTKLISEKTSRRGSMDVACINDIDSYMLSQLGVLETVPSAEVPRLAEVLDVFAKPHSIPHIYSALVVLYNPGKVTTPPKSYADIFDPKYKGRVGFSDILTSYNMAGANIGAGGTPSDFTKGKAALMDLKKLGPKVYPSNEALAAALKSEEVWLSIMWLARGFMWKQAGIPVEMAVPEEGAVPILFEAGVPKNSRAKDGAFKYLNAMLDPKAQVAFAQKMGYVPTVKDAKLPEDLARQISLTEAQQAKLRPLDYATMQQQQAAFTDFWNKEFKA